MTRSELELRQMRRRIREILALRRLTARAPLPRTTTDGGIRDVQSAVPAPEPGPAER